MMTGRMQLLPPSLLPPHPSARRLRPEGLQGAGRPPLRPPRPQAPQARQGSPTLKLRETDDLDPRQREALDKVMELDPQARRAWEEYGLTYRAALEEHRSRIKRFNYMARRTGR